MIRLSRVVQQLDRREDVDVVYLISDYNIVSFFLSFYYRHVTVQLCIRVCEIHTIYIYRSLYCLYSHSTSIGPPHSMPI